ncbi:hypothetical protein [Nocardia sp. NPDC005825]|uniref:hypothetical protein n=1 Tax=unclassified Nocardia TaxID=2637762 RepID=UPI00341182AB
MNSDSSEVFQDQAGATIVRFRAGPRTAVQITRGELAMRWRGSDVWLIAAAVTGVIMAYRLVKHLIWVAGSPGTYYTWTSIPAALATSAAIYIGVLLVFVCLSLREARHGSRKVRAYAYPGAALQVRYLSDGLEVTTTLSETTYPFAHCSRMRVRDNVVVLTGPFGQLVLPRELVPAGAISLLERSITSMHNNGSQPSSSSM